MGLGAWRHQAITRTNVDLSSLVPAVFNRWQCSADNTEDIINKKCLKIARIKYLPHLSVDDF